LEEVGQLLWAAGGKTIDGITGATRAYPSAGGIYPLEIYLVAGNVVGLAQGIYRYEWKTHTLGFMKKGDFREELTRAAWGQRMVAHAPVSIIFTAVYPRTTRRYGERGRIRYVPMDVGGAGQNVHLQAEALGLGTVIIGAFSDEAVKEILGVKNEVPLYIMPVGRPLKR
jgi:SagB-type dehydrogenase family enzyme